MRINGRDYPNIGHIRAKALSDGHKWLLEIYPPTPGPLQGHEPAHMAEVTVSRDEVGRLDSVASHLMLDSSSRARDAFRAGGGLKTWTREK